MSESNEMMGAMDLGADRDMRIELGENLQPGARIKVIGVGGGGSNAVSRMVASGLSGVEFIVANTDAQALATNAAPRRLQIGEKLTKGLGAGADPTIGRQAALEDTEEIISALDGADMVVVTTGLGGGTGTGAAPVIAGLASELGALTVAVVTKPFRFEGKRRAQQAERGLQDLRKAVDTVIAIPNDKLLETIEANTSVNDAFAVADDVLHQAIHGISNLIHIPGQINLDFADVKAIMSGMGMAIMGTGYAEGENRGVEAAKLAMLSPLLEEANVEGAHGVILHVTGGPDLGLHEVDQAATVIQEAAHEDANFIFGSVVDPDMEGRVKITVIATGFDEVGSRRAQEQTLSATVDTPVDLKNYSNWKEEESAELDSMSANGNGGIAISRRPLIELPLSVDTTDSDASVDSADDLEISQDQESEDVPAFMRRHVE